MHGHRAERVSEALREELDEIIAYELADPRISGVAVVEVVLDPGMRHAHIRANLQAGQADRQAALEALDHARHYLRRLLAERLRLFRVPELHFTIEEATAPGTRLDRLLKRARKSRARQSPPEPGAP